MIPPPSDGDDDGRHEGATVTDRAWHPRLPEPTPTRTGKHELVETVRELVHDVALLASGDLDPGQLGELTRQTEQLRKRVASLPSLSRHGGAARAPGDDSALFERSPLSGRGNPLAAPLHIRFDGTRTLAHATYGPAHEGPPGTVHGGHVVAAFDDVLGVAQAASGHAGMTGTLTVRLRAPTPLYTRIDYEAGVGGVDGRKITAWGRSTVDGQLVAEAEGIFIAPRDGSRPDK